MHNGPHESGNASYPSGTNETGYLNIYSTMTVPELPKRKDGITYYIWTDIFFGDVGNGRMNQLVPQLVLGNALDGSSGPPLYIPKWHVHETWMFGAHYFFETLNETTGKIDGHAAYGPLHPAKPGESLYTSFKRSQVKGWVLEMGVVNDSDRVSHLEVESPYMGLGKNWTIPTFSWDEKNYSRVCINACWELYGANDRDHLPSSGSMYQLKITKANHQDFEWVSKWDEDEGSEKRCPSSVISERHNNREQEVSWNISLNSSSSSTS